MWPPQPASGRPGVVQDGFPFGRQVPPRGFVALGMLTSASEEPPPCEAVRCVPAAWVEPARAGGGRDARPPRPDCPHGSRKEREPAPALPEEDHSAPAPASLLSQARAPPQRVWDDAGSHGAQGSVWVINSLRLVAIVPGHEVRGGSRPLPPDPRDPSD